MCLLTETRALSAQGEKRALVGNLTMPSARLQTVDDARHGRFAALLRTFEARTGCPVMVNTSFNVRGEPIVRTPDDALRCFMATGMDALVLGRSVLLKERQPEGARVDADAHLAQFEMD